MVFQKQVNFDTGFGAVGERAFEGPLRALPGILHFDDEASNVAGRYFARSADGLNENKRAKK